MKVLRVESARVVDFCGNSKLSSHFRRGSSTVEPLQKEAPSEDSWIDTPVGFEPRAKGAESVLLNQCATES